MVKFMVKEFIKMRNLVYLLFLSMTVAAQTAPAPVKASTPVTPVLEVTDLEKAGLQRIAQDYQTVLKELSDANIAVQKTHPGYHLDPQNPLSGKLVKDEPVPKTVAKPAEKPVEKK